jgi:hypothetical protein
VIGDERSPPPPTAALAPTRVALRSGRAVEIVEGEEADLIVVRGPSGAPTLTLRITADGPEISFSEASLEIASLGQLSVACEALSVEAGDASIAVGGDVDQTIGGQARRTVGGVADIRARTLKIEASPGGVELRAHGEVVIDGERVRLNSEDPPMPLTREELAARRLSEGGRGAREGRG